MAHDPKPSDGSEERIAGAHGLLPIARGLLPGSDLLVVERSLLESLQRASGLDWMTTCAGFHSKEPHTAIDSATLAELKTNHNRLLECHARRPLDCAPAVAVPTSPAASDEPAPVMCIVKRYDIGEWTNPADNTRISPFFTPEVRDKFQRTGFHHAGFGDAWQLLERYPVSLLLHVHQGLYQCITRMLGEVKVQALTAQVGELGQALKGQMQQLALVVPASVLELKWTVLDMGPLIESAGTFPSMQSDYVIVYGSTTEVHGLLENMKQRFASTGLSSSGDLHVRVWVVRSDSAPFQLTEHLSAAEIAKFHVCEISLSEALQMAAFYHCTLFSPDRVRLFAYDVVTALAFMKALRSL